MVYKRFYNSEEARIQYIIEVLEYIVKDKEYYRSTMTLTEGQEGENRCNNTFICCFSTTDRAVDSSTHCTVSLQIFQSAVRSVDCNVHKPQSDEGSMNQAGYRNTFVLLLHSLVYWRMEREDGRWTKGDAVWSFGVTSRLLDKVVQKLGSDRNVRFIEERAINYPPCDFIPVLHLREKKMMWYQNCSKAITGFYCGSHLFTCNFVINYFLLYREQGGSDGEKHNY